MLSKLESIETEFKWRMTLTQGNSEHGEDKSKFNVTRESHNTEVDEKKRNKNDLNSQDTMRLSNQPVSHFTYIHRFFTRPISIRYTYQKYTYLTRERNRKTSIAI